MFFQLSTSGSSSLSRASENNFTCLLLSKLHYSCGYLVLVLVSVAKPRKILSWFSNTNVPNKNIIIISQIIKVLRSLKKKKQTFSINRVKQVYILKFSSLPQKGKNLRTIKTILRYLLPSKACPVFLLLKDYFQLLLYLSSHFQI